MLKANRDPGQGWFGDHSKGVYVSKHADYTFFYPSLRRVAGALIHCDGDAMMYHDHFGQRTKQSTQIMTRILSWVGRRKPVPGSEGVVVMLELVTGRVRHFDKPDVGVQPSPG